MGFSQTLTLPFMPLHGMTDNQLIELIEANKPEFLDVQFFRTILFASYSLERDQQGCILMTFSDPMNMECFGDGDYIVKHRQDITFTMYKKMYFAAVVYLRDFFLRKVNAVSDTLYYQLSKDNTRMIFSNSPRLSLFKSSGISRSDEESSLVEVEVKVNSPSDFEIKAIQAHKPLSALSTDQVKDLKSCNGDPRSIIRKLEDFAERREQRLIKVVPYDKEVPYDDEGSLDGFVPFPF